MSWIREQWSKLGRSEKRFILILWLLALSLRVIYALSVDLIPADYTGIDMDAVEYDYLGWSVSVGRGVVDRFGDATSFRFPGYIFFLGLIYFIFGYHHLAALLAQAFLGSLSPLLIYFTARQIFAEKTSRLAGLIAACYPVWVYYVGWFLTENLFLFLLNLSLLFVVSLKRGTGWRQLAILGVLLGLLGLTRGVGLPFVGLIPLYAFFRLGGNFQQRLLRAALILGAAILTLFPWTLRNYFVFGQWMLPSSEAGGVLWLGFQKVPISNYYVTEPAFDYVKRVGRKNASTEEFYRLLVNNNVFGITSMKVLFHDYFPDEPPPQSEPESMRRLAQKAMNILFKNPMMWVAKSVTQVFRFWHVLDERGRYVYGYAFIAPFFLAGIWLLRRRIADLLPLYLYLLVIYAVAIVFFADARFRMPFEGVMIIVGAFALERFLSLFRRAYWGYAILAAFFLINFYFRFHAMQVRLAIRAVAGALGFNLIQLE